MKKYSVVLTKSAEKDLYNLPQSVIVKIISALKLLEEEPRPTGCKKLKGYKNLWRIRIGDYRIGLEYRNSKVIFRRILLRKDIYKYFP